MTTQEEPLATPIAEPSPNGFWRRARREWFLAVAAGSVLAFALFEQPLFSRLDNPLVLTAILLWLFGVVLWSSLAVVRHAESLASVSASPTGRCC